jgi:hypothetical protein
MGQQDSQHLIHSLTSQRSFPNYIRSALVAFLHSHIRIYIFLSRNPTLQPNQNRQNAVHYHPPLRRQRQRPRCPPGQLAVLHRRARRYCGYTRPRHRRRQASLFRQGRYLREACCCAAEELRPAVQCLRQLGERRQQGYHYAGLYCAEE